MRAKLAGILAAIALLSLTVTGAVATHSAACAEGNPAMNFASWPIAKAGVAGAEAKIETQAMDYCASATDDDRANWLWVSVFGTRPEEIVQVGLGKCKSPQAQNSGCDGTLNILRAWGRNVATGCGNTVVPWVVKIGEAGAGLNTYNVSKGGATWSFKYNGVVLDTVPTADTCWPTAKASWFGESYDRGDAIGGDAANHQRLTNALYLSVGQWLSPSFAGGDCPDQSGEPPDYRCLRINGQAIDFWTVQ